MKLFMPSNSGNTDWLIFVAILSVAGIGIACLLVWLILSRKTFRKHTHRRRRKHRRTNPTLAQTGGLPPPRNPNEPPRSV